MQTELIITGLALVVTVAAALIFPIMIGVSLWFGIQEANDPAA
jgi:hypothetical protein